MAEKEYTVVPISKKDEDAVMQFLEKTFYLDEPLNQTIGLCAETGTCPELEDYCKHSLHEGLSFMAVDTEGRIVGVVINGESPLREDIENGNDLITGAQRCTNPKFQKILYVLARRVEGSRLWERFPDDRTLVEVKVAATDPGWRRRGIMNALMRETITATKQRKFRLLRIDTSNAYSAKSAERLGFTCVYSALYANIKMDGRPLIVPEPPHLEDRVYIKELF